MMHQRWSAPCISSGFKNPAEPERRGDTAAKQTHAIKQQSVQRPWPATGCPEFQENLPGD